MNVYLIGVLISIAVYIIVGMHAGKNVKNIDDYYVSGRNAPTLLISGTLFASMLSVNGFMGDQAFCYNGNITTLVLLNSICSIGYIIGPLSFGRYLRRSRCTTMPEYFGFRYKDNGIKRTSGIITVISMTAYLLASITGVGILMNELTPFSIEVCYLLSWFAFTAFTFYSGSKGVVITDTLMFILFIGASLIAGPYIFKSQGGLSNLLENLVNNPNAPSGLLDFHGNIAGTGASNKFGAVMYAVTMGIIWLVTVAVSPWQAGRNLMAKSEHVTFRAGAIAAICTVVFLLFINLESVSMINIIPNLPDPQRVLIRASFEVLPNIIGTLLLSGILAAGLSSASTFLSIIGFSVTNDIFYKENRTEKEQLKQSRIIMLLVSLVSLFLSYLGLGGIREISWFSSTIIASSWLIPGIGSIVYKDMSATGARWSMIAGFIGFILTKSLKTYLPTIFGNIFINFLDPFFIGVLLSALACYIGSKKYPASEDELDYRKELLIIPKEEQDFREYKIDKRYGYLLMITGILVTGFLLLNWAIPYNSIVKI